MKVRRWTSLASLVVVGLVSCNAILGNAESIDYVDGDAFAPARDSATDDATPVVDGEIADASAEKVDPLFPDSDVPCDSAVFCSDFDPPLDVQPWGWMSVTPNGGAQFAIDGTNAITKPNALRVALAGPDQAAYVSTTIEDAGRPFGVSFYARVVARNDNPVEILRVSCRVNINLRVGIDALGRAFLAESATTSTGASVPVDQWVRVILTINPADTKLEVLGASPTSISIARSCLTPFSISLGIISQSTPWTMLFDRVRVTVP